MVWGGMRILQRLFTPLVAFIAIQCAWLVVVVAWVLWFLGTHRELRRLAETYAPQLSVRGLDWIVLVEGLVLLAVILAGVYVIYLYWRRQAALYRAQRTFVSQVTHELKSPLASLRLHLETVRLRRPDPGQIDGFVDTMLGDVDRLEGLIENLLAAARLEQRAVQLALRTRDLSELVSRYVAERFRALPPDVRLDLDVEAGLVARVEPESIEVVLRNLLENAVLYSAGPPRISVSLSREGRWAHLAVADRGAGLERRDLKRVFRMFYRVRQPGRSVRGSGLGLFIVRTVARRHGGRVWAESPGPGQGATFHLLLPLEGGRTEP